MFNAHVRREDPGGQVLEAFEAIVPAATTLVAHHFEQMLLKAALDYVQGEYSGGISGTALQEASAG
jgi:hypothetical protein